MKFADLHLHTIYSDGTYTPQKLVRDAAAAGLSAISVCDHDTVDGIMPTIESANKVDMEVLPGIELTCEDDGTEIHILGYCIDHTDTALRDELVVLRNIRNERVYKICAKLKIIGIDLSPEKVFAISEGGTVSRLHIARSMVKEGIVGSVTEAFQKYIGDKCPAYVCGFRYPPESAIKLIKSACGIPVLAHPYSLHNDELIPKFVEFGIMGLEVYYPEHSQGMINYYLGLAQKYNLLATGGSDCHGDAKSEVRIGSMKIPYDLVQKIKDAKPKLL